MSIIAFSGRVTFRVLDSRRLFDWNLLIRHLHTLVWIVLPSLVSRIAAPIFLHAAAATAVDAEIFESRVLVGPLLACHSHLLITSLQANGDRGAELQELICDRMSDPSSSFYGFDAIGVPVQDRQVEAISQKWVVLRGKVLLDGLQISRKGL